MTSRNDLLLIDGFLKRLFPLQRSLSGDGNRETLRILTELIPLTIKEYPAGTRVYDWTIPDEWKIHDAWIADSSGNRLIDFQKNNLHVVGYSEPVKTKMLFAELASKLYCLPSLPDAIPYRTTYYKQDWGFCVNANQYEELQKEKEELEIVIDSEFLPEGSMSIGELYIEGKRAEEYLVSTYICHPSMANDNLSGVITTALLAQSIIEREKPEYSWRFLFVPETIGPLAYLCHNEETVKSIQGGLVVTCCGGPGQLGYKKSYLGNHIVDRAVVLAFRDLGISPVCYPFFPTGSDERQYSSPGFRIPIATVCKDKYYEYREYHTSLDNLELVTAGQIGEALSVYIKLQKILDENRPYQSRASKGEPNLGKRGLYPSTGGGNKQPSSFQAGRETGYSDLDAITWLLFLADGEHDLLTIAERSGIPFEKLAMIARRLEHHQLIAAA